MPTPNRLSGPNPPLRRMPHSLASLFSLNASEHWEAQYRGCDVDVAHLRYDNAAPDVGPCCIENGAHGRQFGIVTVRAVEVGHREDARCRIEGCITEPRHPRVLRAVEIVSLGHDADDVAGVLAYVIVGAEAGPATARWPHEDFAEQLLLVQGIVEPRVRVLDAPQISGDRVNQ